MKNGLFLDDGCVLASFVQQLCPWDQLVTALLFPAHGNSNCWRGAGTSSIRCRHVTVSILAWPASSGAAVLAASCLSESLVPLVVGTSTRTFREQNNWIQFLNNTIHCPHGQKIFSLSNKWLLLYLQPLDMGSCNVDLWNKMIVSHSSKARTFSILQSCIVHHGAADSLWWFLGWFI